MKEQDAAHSFEEFKGHTPGPWSSDEVEYSLYVFGPDGEVICEMRGWGYLTGNRRNLSYEEALKIQKSNCKLIAAVPSLLAELTRLRSELQQERERKMEIIKLFEKMNNRVRDMMLRVDYDPEEDSFLMGCESFIEKAKLNN